MMRAVFLLALMLAMAGCSSTGEGQRLARDVVARIAPGLLPADPVPRYQRLEQAGAPALTVTHAPTGRRAALRRVGQMADGTVLWLAPDGAGFSFLDGVLVATRGAGADLQGADVSELLALMRSGHSGTAERFHAYLDGTGGIALRSYVCTVTQGVGQVLEDCAGLTGDFINSYQIAPGGGGVLASRQHPGPLSGAFHFDAGTP